MPTTATAAIVSELGGEFKLEEIELDDPRADEILVRIAASGVCHTDQIAQAITPLPAVLGHEGTGTVEKVGTSVTRVKPGDRVVISYPWCGECAQCVGGHGYRCEQVLPISFGGTRLDGSETIKRAGKPISGAFFQQSSFSTHAITLERDVVPVDEDNTPEMLAAIPCGVQTGAGSILNTLKVGAGQSLVIFGTGAVGLSALMAAKISGAAPLIAVDIIAERLELARELGATHTINAAEGDTEARVKEICPRGVDFSFNTTENVQVLEDAVNVLVMGGTCGIVTTANHGEKFMWSTNAIFQKTARLQGIIQGSALPNLFLPKLIELQRQGRFPYERLIKTYPFEDINKAFADSIAGTAIKPVLLMP